MHFFMVFHQRLDGLWRQLEGDLVLGDHVDMNDVCFDIQDLIIEQSLDERVGIFAKFRIRCLGEHERTQRPDGGWRGEGLGQASKVLRHAVQWPLDSVYPLQCRRQPGIYLGVQDNIWSGSRSKGGSGGGEESDGHRNVLVGGSEAEVVI